MARGVYGTGAGFDAAAAGKVGGRWKNPSEAERRLAILQVCPLSISEVELLPMASDRGGSPPRKASMKKGAETRRVF